MAIVKLTNVEKIYPLGKTEVHAVKGVSFEIEKSDFISIAGPSGSGKSTILNMIGCIDTPTSGIVEIAGQVTEGLTDRSITTLRHRVIGFISQSFNLIPVLNVYENVEFPLLLGQTEMSKAEKAEWIDYLIEAVGWSSGRSTGLTSFPEVSASGWLLPVPWLLNHGLCWRMNQRLIWILLPAKALSG